MQWTLYPGTWLAMCQAEAYTGSHAVTKSPLHAAVNAGNSLEIFRMLGDGHIDDVQGVLVMLLGREKQCQQVESIGIIPAHRQGLLKTLHGAGDLPGETASLGTLDSNSSMEWLSPTQVSLGHQKPAS